ncbi:hypothetical protein SLS63_006643 [Diaporthe eres]|uniref:Septin-type G domain-containing protein n=1 Tax=Diaporthe eres TaxID=83184 RepID=A0ABR1P7S0_DIAER
MHSITSYFIGGEDAVDAALQQSLASFTAGSRDYRKAGSVDAEPAKHSAQSDRESISTFDPADADDISLMSDTAPSRLNLPGATSNLSQPITPLMLATPGSPSAISDSMSASFSEDIASQALSMSQDLEPLETSEMMDSGSAPQLVMPSIKMPSRRPFTDGGKRLGRLKVLVAGDSELKPADIKYLQLLASLTNVIPLVAKADNMTPEDVAQSKAQIRSELMEAGVRPFSFTVSSTGIFDNTEPKYPYAVSSTPGSDHDIMDASLLMSPDYVQPLMQSELAAVVDQVFCENGASWLRHAAAKKFIQWKNADNSSRPRALYKPMGLPGSPSMPLVTAGTFSSPVGATSQYSLARIADHTQREERLAQIRLANWASELQRSLANERARYDALARGERAIWLTEKLHECVQDGELVPFAGRDRSDSRLGEKTRRRSGRGRCHSTSTTQSQDPLGLLRVAARVKANGWIALEVLGGVGILGGAAVWLTGQEWPAIEWAVDQWSAFWGGER